MTPNPARRLVTREQRATPRAAAPPPLPRDLSTPGDTANVEPTPAEIAYAVLVHHDSDATWEEIDAAVRAQIEAHRQDAEALSEAMRPETE